MKNKREKKKKAFKIVTQIFLSSAIFLILFYFLNVVFAWVGPTEDPLDGNVDLISVCDYTRLSCTVCCYLYQGSYEGGVHLNDQYNFMTECPSEEDWEQYSSSPNIWKDNVTGLYWTAEQSVYINWQNSIDLCLGLNDSPSYGGLTGWRIPTKDELMQVAPASHGEAYKGGHDLNANTDIGNTNLFWSRNERSDKTNDAWGVRLSTGNVSSIFKTTTGSTLSVRCVSRD